MGPDSAWRGFVTEDGAGNRSDFGHDRRFISAKMRKSNNHEPRFTIRFGKKGVGECREKTVRNFLLPMKISAFIERGAAHQTTAKTDVAIVRNRRYGW